MHAMRAIAAAPDPTLWVQGVMEPLVAAPSSDLGDQLAALAPQEALQMVERREQKGIPALAKDAALISKVEEATRRAPTCHSLVRGDGRRLDDIANESVHLVVTSPPYWSLKAYPERDGQLGLVYDYEAFLAELDQVWRHVLRVLVPGGRLVVVVGDVCLSRRQFGRHVVYPLHASIQEQCRRLGFDNLAPIVWHKITNAQYEVNNGSGGFLGKPYEPNAIIKNDIEFILFQRKRGGYRQPTLAARVLSVIPEPCHREWYRQVWTIGGASTREHPAPFPLDLAERLVRMFSFVGDTILDPFMGTGTTNLAAGRWGRNSIGYEIEPAYVQQACRRLEAARLTVSVINGVK